MPRIVHQFIKTNRYSIEGNIYVCDNAHITSREVYGQPYQLVKQHIPKKLYGKVKRAIVILEVEDEKDVPKA